MQLLLTYHMKMPSIVEEAVKNSGIPHGERLFELFEYKDHICHLCNGVNPNIHYVLSMLQDAIWKRYKKIAKIVNEEVKVLAKGSK